MTQHMWIRSLVVVAVVVIHAAGAAGQQPVAGPARGPLRVHADNPRYFTDGSGKAVLLVGSHTWNNLIDMGKSDPPEKFNYDEYLEFLEKHNHNFIRLWAWDSATWDTRANRNLGKDYVHYVAPLPWPRSGPGNAPDGKPKFDLNTFNDEYFTRLRARCEAAGQRGIYVSVMLFEGWGLFHGNRRPAAEGWSWNGHPFNPKNNASGINADPTGDGKSPQVHSRAIPAVNTIQQAYIRKVVDTVNDLDNILYEVINEGGGQEWDWWVVEQIRQYERGKPKQHPIGITGHGAERVSSMLASPADWISPGRNDGYGEEPPAWDGKKVSLHDTDHVWGVGGNAAWVWKSFLRGHNPIFMDPYDGSILGRPGDPQWEPIRRSMGHVRKFAERVDLAKMTPQDALATSGFCLARVGKEYLVLVPQGTVTVDLSKVNGDLRVEWFDITTGKSAAGGMVPGGARRELKAPSAEAAVLYLTAAQ